MSKTATTLVQLLGHQAAERGDALCQRFLLKGDASGPMVQRSFAELDLLARRVGAHLQALGTAGERALLLYPPGPGFTVGFFGCLNAGMIAVPAFPPSKTRPERAAGRLKAMVLSSGAKFVLAPKGLCHLAGVLADLEPSLSGLTWVATDALPIGVEADWVEPEIGPNDLALLQYTSGSTGHPKGVMVSHGNLMHNASLTRRAFRVRPGAHGVIWLPAYHDMGLIGGIIQPVYSGFGVTLMSPMAFVRRPLSWLTAISQFEATISGGPDFALRLAVQRTTASDLEQLDLSSLTVMFTGAEPVRSDTLQTFATHFAPCGFDPRAFYPTYGLAETTLQVSGPLSARPPLVRTFGREALSEQRVDTANVGPQHEFVSNGPILEEFESVVVDPETHVPRGPGQVGELWLRGPSVAQGYWNKPEATQTTFRATTADGSGPWLRTGDLAFLDDGELFIAGRCKDLIILRGRNVHPHDVETCAKQSEPRIGRNYAAAVGVEVVGEERILLVVEVDTRGDDFDPNKVIAGLRDAVFRDLEVELWSVVVVRKGSIPRTSSGKVRRSACAAALEAGELSELARDTLPTEVAETSRREVPTTYEDALAALRELVGEAIGRPVDHVDPRQAFQAYGIDSVRLVQLIARVELRFDRAIEPEVAFRYPNMAALARHLVQPQSVEFVPVPAPTASSEPIAIVGMGCRMPGGVDSPETLWKLLMDGVDAVGDVPLDRWNSDSWYNPDPTVAGRMATRWGGFVEGIRDFDHGFFGIAPVEARNMDPQQRLLMEVTWEALEHAGLPPSQLEGTATGVYVGICSSDYSHRNVPINAYTGLGSAFSVAAGRISYFLGLQGPSLAVDTACSSSLVATHLACEALRRGEVETALVGGVNALLSPDVMVFFSQTRALSPTGRCRTFDESADGYVRSDGCAVIVLKRLSAAQANGDRILGLIRGSATNQDGRSNGLTAPNGRSQEAVIRTALAHAGLTADEVDYHEAHGTGTPLGDPIELTAIGAVHEGRDGALLVGSIKANIGHTEGAAGLAGLIKATMAVQSGTVPANLHLSTPTPRVKWASLPLEVVQQTQPFGRPGRTRVAGVSSFGMGGSNAHIIVEQPRLQGATSTQMDRPLNPLVLSARTPGGLRAQAARLRVFLATMDDDRLPDLCHTLAVGRDHFALRFARMVGSTSDAVGALDELLQTQPAASAPEAPSVAFLFTGQGSQYAEMASQLYATQPVFRAAIDDQCRLLDPGLDRPLLELLLDPESPLAETGFTQPALFALEMAMAELWRAWGIEPSAVVGHSIGEIAAACFAGVLTREDAARLVLARARLMQALPTGGVMVSVAADESTVRAAIGSRTSEVSVAAVNAPGSVVLSGSADATRAVAADLDALGARSTELMVSHAFHSHLMQPMVSALRGVVADMPHNAPRTPVFTSLEGATLDPLYWPRQVRGCVHFGAALNRAVQSGCTALIEVGPHPVLLELAARGAGRDALRLPSLRRRTGDWAALGESVCRLYEAGADIDWRAFDAPYARSRMSAPTYAFQRVCHWVEEEPGADLAAAPQAHPLLGSPLDVAGTHAWEAIVSVSRVPWLGDHVVAGRVVFPASAWLEHLRSGATHVLPNPSLFDVQIEQMLSFRPDEARRLQIVAREADDGFVIEAFSRPSGPEGRWTRHARAVARSLVAGDETAWAPPAEYELDVTSWREDLASVGLQYGPAFCGLTQLWATDNQAWAQVTLPHGCRQGAQKMGLHPALLDAAFQAASVLPGAHKLFLPVGAERVDVHQVGAHMARVHLFGAGDTERRVNLLLADADGKPIATIHQLRLRPVDPKAFGVGNVVVPQAYRMGWMPSERPEGYVEMDGRWLVRGDNAVVPLVSGRLTETGDGLRGAIFVWASLSDGDPAAACLSLVEFARELLGEGGAPLLIATVGDSSATAALWGLGRTLTQEAPSLDCRLVSLDVACSDAENAARVVHEARRLDRETQVSWSDGERRVARLSLVGAAPLELPASENFGVVQTKSGALDGLMLESRSRQDPGPGEVEIDVEAWGLNFRDVLNALGMIPGPERPLGGEFSGRVVALGAGVSHLAIGDRVMAMAPAAFGRFVTTDARMAVRCPVGIGAEEAATVPIAFVTAWYALVELAELKAGERILIHAAAGGVGMAAAQVARHLGAEVHGTASRPKWKAALANGAHHIYDSRSLEFGDGVRAATDGAGVHVVLNALTGDALRETFRTLGDQGRFIEMGKLELLDEGQVAAFHPSAQYQAFDLVDMDRDHLHELLLKVADGLAKGILRPLPRRVFGVAQTVEAFRYMSQARHVGKVVVCQNKSTELDDQANYLVTGGFGGLGRHVARWLVASGARQLVLTSTGPLDDERRAFLESLAPATVRVAQLDLAEKGQVDCLLDELRDGFHPLKGLVHAAGVTSDGPLAELDAARFARVWGPKADAANWLDVGTRDLHLEFFVLFSSVAGTLGSPGQAAYAAANSALDAVAERRHAAGQRAVSIAWGPWSGPGMAERMDARGRHHLLRRGLRFLPVDGALASLERAIRGNEPRLMVASLDVERMGTVHTLPAWLSELARASVPHGESWSDALAEVPPADRHEHIVGLLRDYTARVIGSAAVEDIDPNLPLRSLGLDSLMAVDLQNALSEAMREPLPETLLLDHSTLHELARALLARLGLVSTNLGPAKAAAQPEPATGDVSEAEDALLSELAMLEALLE